MSTWQPMDIAPTDGRRFLVLDECGEVFVARFEEYGRLCYRMHNLYCDEKHRIIDAEMDGKPVQARVPIGQPWQERFEHMWVMWQRGFEFKPKLWASLQKPEAA